MFFYIALAIVFIPLVILLPVKIIGRKNMKKNKKFILCCNHMSNYDSILILLKRRKKMTMLAKAELFNNKFYGWVLRHLGAIPITRDAVKLNEIKRVYATLKNDKPVCIFPQGTRKLAPEIDAHDIKNGVAMFAIKTGAPVVPAVFNKKIRMFKRSKLIIGEPIDPSGFTTEKESIDEFSAIICNKMNAMLLDEKEKENARNKKHK